MGYLPRQNMPLAASQMAAYAEHNASEKLARLLYIRGIDTSNKIKQFLNPSVKQLHNPFFLNGMRECVDRINSALTNKQRILLIGDYDADGICSVAILYKYLLWNNADVKYFLPNRITDGYGLNVETIKALEKKFKPNLIITVDCGISCVEEIEFAKKRGIDVIVTDHHAIPEVVPNCIIVNPKLSNQKYPFSHLCGAGVALKVVQALGGINAALKLIDICAIATVADIVSLTDENRAIVVLGLEKINSGSLPGITALMQSCKINDRLTSTDISFKLGPKINASGRMGNAKRGLDLILSNDKSEIDKIITSLNNYNVARQKLCNDIYDECDCAIADTGLCNNNIIIAYNEKWDSGVLGIVAARITENYCKPSIVLTKVENGYKGSARSIGEIDIVAVFERFKDYLESYGGHSMAAGITVKGDKYEEFVQEITNFVNTQYTLEGSSIAKFYDFNLTLEEITNDFQKQIEILEPFGCDNPRPTFATTVKSTQVMPMPNYPNHINIKIPGKTFLLFNGANQQTLLKSKLQKQIIFEFQKADKFSTEKNVKCIAKAVFADGRLDCSRETFAYNYNIIRQNPRLCLNITDPQFKFVVDVFCELGILEIKDGFVKVNNGAKRNLEDSKIYQKAKAEYL